MPHAQIELTPEQEKKWDATRTAFLWHNPAFAAVFYQLMNNAHSRHIALFTKDVPIAATDGSNLILNPDEFFKLTLPERVFVVSHEVAHCIFNHCGLGHQWNKRGKVAFADGTTLPYEHEQMNVAMDLVINDMLIDSGIGQMPSMGCHDPKVASFKDSVVDTYKKIYQKDPGGGRGGYGGFDQHLPPGASQGKDPVTADAQRSASEWGSVVAAAAQSARVQGKLPGALNRLLEELLDPQVDWKEKIQAMMFRKLGSGGYSWRRPDRNLIVRDIYAPGRTGFGCGDVVIGVDTSGSIGPKELDMFMAEMAGILEDCRPKRLVIVWCDAQVGRVDEAEDAQELMTIRAKGAPGGGGTSFVPVFDKVREMGLEPEALVYLTDGMGTFPAQPPGYPVIWGNIYPASKYPFGEVVDIPKQAA